MMPNAELVMLDATGHCPNLSAPEATIAAMTRPATVTGYRSPYPTGRPGRQVCVA